MSFHGFFRFDGETKDERIDRYEIEDGQKYGRLRASRINALRDEGFILKTKVDSIHRLLQPFLEQHNLHVKCEPPKKGKSSLRHQITFDTHQGERARVLLDVEIYIHNANRYIDWARATVVKIRQRGYIDRDLCYLLGVFALQI